MLSEKKNIGLRFAFSKTYLISDDLRRLQANEKYAETSLNNKLESGYE